jgi:hypothetical protein
VKATASGYGTPGGGPTERQDEPISTATPSPYWPVRDIALTGDQEMSDFPDAGI